MNKPIPDFKNEDEERTFWAEHDSSEYVDWSKAKRAAFPNLKPSTRAISLRLPESMLNELRQLANQRDVPYQSLIKIFLRERIDMEHTTIALPRDLWDSIKNTVPAGKRSGLVAQALENELRRRKRMEQFENLGNTRKKCSINMSNCLQVLPI